MEQPTTAFTMPSSVARRNFVVAMMLFNWILILLLIWRGDSANSLHASAMAWAFAVSAATFGTYVFGAVWDNMILMQSKKTT